MAEPDPVSAHALDVVEGRVPACRFQRLAADRHMRELELQGSAEFPYRFDAGLAARGIGFFPALLTHSKGEWAGRALHLRGWQQFVVGQLHGWRHAAGDREGFRRFRKGFVEIPRKNGKTVTGGGLGLQMGFFDGEPGAEAYAVATKRDQAKISWEEARRMVRASPSMRKRIKAFANNLSWEKTNSKFEPLGADKSTLDGLNPHFVLVDELHAHKDREVLAKMVTATGSRRQPFVLIITTAGEEGPSVWGETHEYAEAILQGLAEDHSYLVFMTGIDEGDSWEDPAAWAKANPNLGVSCKLEQLQDLARQAKVQTSVRMEFERFHLNVVSKRVARWIDPEAWDACKEPVDPVALEGQRCFVGLDLSSKVDLTAMVLVFPRPGGALELIPHFWIPEERVASRADAGVPYREWVRDGLLHTTPGNVIDHDFIKAQLLEACKRYEVVEAGFDPWSATQFSVKCAEDGVEMVEVRQGYKTLSEPSKAFEAAIASRALRHDGHKVLRWCVLNTCIEMDPAGNIKPSKKASKEKIDGAVAGIIAMSRVILQPEDTSSVYEQRGVIWL